MSDSASRGLTAVVWDFDGTLADTRHRNFAGNRRIFTDLTGRPADEVAVLRSFEAYEEAWQGVANWRDFYRVHLGLVEEMVDAAGRLWAEVQRQDPEPAPLIDGVAEALAELAHLPHGIVSQNDRIHIERTLDAGEVGHRFTVVIGYAEVGMERQKPAPDGLLASIERLTASRPGLVLYVGDHPTDVETARNADRELARNGSPVRVESVVARFPGIDGSPAAQTVGHDGSPAPDHVAHHPRDVVEICRRRS